jgi:short-subunit dehydrogenase
MNLVSHFRDKSILITGASSGIGEELSLQLARLGAQLTLVARRTERLEALSAKITASAGHPPLVLHGDVTQDGQLEQAVAETLARRGRLDIAIANAGFGVAGEFARLTLDDYRRQFETNVFGVLRTLYAALPALEASHGQLVLIGSVAGWSATPGTSAYAMSKHAVRALANSITPELARVAVKVTLISPGFVESDIRRIDNQGRLHPRAAEPIPSWLLVSRASAARQILRAIAQGRREAIITRHGKVIVAVERFAPWLVRLAGRRMAARGKGYRAEPKG